MPKQEIKDNTTLVIVSFQNKEFGDAFFKWLSDTSFQDFMDSQQVEQIYDEESEEILNLQIIEGITPAPVHLINVSFLKVSNNNAESNTPTKD